MQLSTTIRSPGALALGAFFAAVTARNIFDDVWIGAPVTVAHLNSAAALVSAIASGHMAWPQLKSGKLVSAFVLLVIFAASTFYIITSAGARNAELSGHKAAAIEHVNGERASLRTQIDKADAAVQTAQGDYDQAKAAAAKECGSGKGQKCDGRVVTRDNAANDLQRASAHADALRSDLVALGPEELPYAGYKKAAAVFASLPYVTSKGEAIEARLVLWLPFALVLISEASTLVFLAIGLGHVAPAGRKDADLSEAELAEVRRTFFASDQDVGDAQHQANTMPAPSATPERNTDAQQPNDAVATGEVVVRTSRAEQVKTFCTLFREQSGREPTFSEVRDGLNLPAATASKYRRAALG